MNHQLQELEFDTFWSEPVKISLGIGNFTFKAETLGVLTLSAMLGYLIWGVIGFRLYLPIGNLEVSWLGIVICGGPLFLIYKLLTLKKSTADVFDSLIANLYQPRVELSSDVELVPVLFVED
jgi:hypothetical protein